MTSSSNCVGGLVPDASVICGSLRFDPEDDRQHTMLNPKVVIEV